MRNLLAVAVLAATPILTGCGNLLGGCDQIVVPALRIEIVDAPTGAWKADSAHGWAQRQGGPSEPLQAAEWRVDVTGVTITHLGVSGSGGGRYTVHVERNGYRSWDRQQVRVESGSCGVETTRLTAALEPGS